MKVGIVGASGLVGTALCELLAKEGHTWVGYSRKPKGKKGEWCSLEEGFAGLDAIVNLAGESVAQRWTEAKRAEFYRSRVDLTKSVVAGIEKLPEGERPEILFNASAVGYYGDQGTQVLIEDSPAGTGFLAELCVAWEEAACEAESLGVRVCLGRSGVVLSKKSEAWKKMRRVFGLGLGGRLGSGEQYWPVVHVDDVAGGILHALTDKEISGAVNLVGATPVTNQVFTEEVGKTLKRPTLFPAPAFGLQLILGDFSQALLDSYRVMPAELEHRGYEFRYQNLTDLLASLK